MTYNFDQLVERRGTNATKWDGLQDLFGRADALPMWVADMDFVAPEPIQQALLDRARHPVYGYTLKPPHYAEVIQGWLQRRHGWRPPEDALVHVNGVVQGLAVALAAYTRPDDGVLVFPPVYHPFFAITEGQGRRIVESPLAFDGQRYTIDFDGLTRLLAATKVKVAILCNPHNPVARVWTAEEMRRLADILLRHQILVLSDEIHSDLLYPGYRHIPFASLSDEAARRSITFVAPSKTFGLAGLQTSVGIIPDRDLRERYLATQRAFGTGLINTFGIAAMLAAYGQCEDWLDQLLQYLAGTRDMVLAYFAEHIPQIRPIRPEGTYMIWLDCRELGLDDDGLKRFMVDQAGLALSPGSDFGTGGQGFQRMNLAMPRALVQKGLDQLAEAVRALARA